ncbi:putative ATP-grasp-modified RiPP [Amycolatopsis aidingensis]|uniref:putative ATP-grasp-modified RiPP n=1 Tax=Amycolatopsis aidingensis TaxID=2842453 RepID=UPI001C0B8FA2|nr:putative ATP-grasp-modified RiPP [Amycolatopsis aidingensis]
MTTVPDPLLDDNPLSSAQIRYCVRVPAASATPGPQETRPFGLLFAQARPTPTVRSYSYCHELQVAVGDDGVPLIEMMGKEWESKSSTDGDEGPEENWGWEEK